VQEEVDVVPAVQRERIDTYRAPAHGVLWPVRVFLATAVLFAAATMPAGGWVVPLLLVAVAVVLWRFRAVIGPWEASAVGLIALGEALLLFVAGVMG